ncbi:MAG TPA: anti-sigma factor, partial [Acidimicrobiales bacterium]|nr:anti-sigma factor [Acidimicrobiales bacterium]
GLAAAAAALVLVVVVGAVALARDGDDDGGSVVASAELEPLPDEPTGAASPTRADLVDHDGRLQLDLSTGDLPDADGFYEVWLIDTNVDGMVSLGPARADGTYSVPSGVDPAQFPIVDVSIEPPDGDPTHSGVSVLRGTLA